MPSGGRSSGEEITLSEMERLHNTRFDSEAAKESETSDDVRKGLMMAPSPGSIRRKQMLKPTHLKSQGPSHLRSGMTVENNSTEYASSDPQEGLMMAPSNRELARRRSAARTAPGKAGPSGSRPGENGNSDADDDVVKQDKRKRRA